jgi:hypothetical protein
LLPHVVVLTHLSNQPSGRVSYAMFLHLFLADGVISGLSNVSTSLIKGPSDRTAIDLFSLET